MARMSVSSTGSLMKENLENKAQCVSCKEKQEQHTMAVVVCVIKFVRAVLCVCVCACVPLLDHTMGKYCDRSRPSYSNQKIKVPFSTSCPLLYAIINNYDSVLSTFKGDFSG